MATVLNVAWRVAYSLVWLCWLIGGVVWVVRWRRGRESIRDERGRLRPGIAAVVAFMVVVPVFVIVLAVVVAVA